MSRDAARKWAAEHGAIFDELMDAATTWTVAFGRALGAMAAHGALDQRAKELFHQQVDAAEQMLALISRARSLPRVPDPETQRHLEASLRLWTATAEFLAKPSRLGLGRKVARRSGGISPGLDEFLRASAALRRAAGQPPEPTNPYR